MPRNSAIHGLNVFTSGLLFAGMLLQPPAGTPWGLDRIDQRALPLDSRFVPPGDGAGVQAYVIDTGVRRSHREFGGRADWIGDFTSDNPVGHGTDLGAVRERAIAVTPLHLDLTHRGMVRRLTEAFG